MLATNNTTLFTSNTASGYSASSNVHSYGNYYNWYSATAGHGKYGNDHGYNYIAPGDVCPAGWHLPTGNTSGEFSALDSAMGGTGIYQGTSQASNRWRSFPNNLVYSGYVGDTSVANRGFYGTYWSSSADNVSRAHILGVNENSVSPSMSVSEKHYGYVVRCVAGV